MNPLCGNSLGIVAHRHISEVGAVVDAILVFGKGFDDAGEVRLVEICKSITLTCIKAHLVWRRWKVVVRQVLHHVPYGSVARKLGWISEEGWRLTYRERQLRHYRLVGH